MMTDAEPSAVLAALKDQLDVLADDEVKAAVLSRVATLTDERWTSRSIWLSTSA